MKNHFRIISVLVLAMLLFSGCKKLSLFKDYEFNAHTIDPNQNITAWEYINKPRTDTLFNMMIRGIKYAGLEEEYKKPNRTYILLINAAITAPNATTGVESATTYFGMNKVNGVASKNWQSYSVAPVKDLLMYHIIQGRYTYDNLKTDVTETVSLRTDAAKNKVYLNIANTNNFKIQFNNFPKTIKTQDARTSNLQMNDNCVIHVIPTYMEYGVTP